MTDDENLLLRCYANMNYLLGLYEHAKVDLSETVELVDEIAERLVGSDGE